MKRFFGWWVVTGATIGLALGFSNIAVASFSLFVLPLSNAFGWGRGDISVALMLTNFSIVVLAPIAGMLVDRYGARRILLPSIVLFAAAVASLATLTGDIRGYYAHYVLLAVLGIGTIPATYTRVIIAWFDQKRGLAIGVTMAGVGIGATLLPLFLQYLTGTYGWRAGYLGLAALVLCISFPAVLLLLRERPEDLGQLPDGMAQAAGQSQASPIGFEFAQCWRQRSFWLMATGFLLLGFFTSGVMAHLVPLLRDRGVSPTTAALGASLLGVSLIAGRIACGHLMDKFHAPRVVIGFLLGPVIGLAMLASGAQGATAFASIVLIGLGIGAELDFMSYLVSRYLGPHAYGRSYGAMYAVFLLSSGVGSLLMGYAQQRTGSYDLGLWTLFTCTLLSLLPFSRLGAYPALPTQAERTASL